MKSCALWLLLVALLSVASVAEERPQRSGASAPVPVIRTLEPNACLQPGAVVQIIGEHFGPRQRPLQLLSANTRLPLDVVRWSDTRIEVRLPAATRLSDARYQLGLTTTDGRWLGEPLGRLSLCPPATRPVDLAPEAQRPESTPARPQVPSQPLPAESSRSAAELPSRPAPELIPESELRLPSQPTVPHPEPTAPVQPSEPDTSRVESEPSRPRPAPESDSRTESSAEHPRPSPALLPDTRLLDMPLPSPAPASAPVSDEDSEPDQLMILTRTMAEAEALTRTLGAEGIRIKVRKPLDALGLVMSVMRLPRGTNVAQTAAELQTRFPDAVIDANHRYQLQGNDPKTYSVRQIGWQLPPASCLDQVRVGVLDTAAEGNHPALAGAALTQQSFIGRETPAGSDHGTAVAVLLAGGGNTEFVSLLPGATILVAEVFREGANGPETTTEYLLDGLNWVLAGEVDVINMSLGGPRNRALAWALEAIMQRGVAVVAAAGNSGANAPPVYPAAEPGVVAVTAVDAAARRYRHANIGDYIDVAAPGVDLWLANSHGSGSYRSGSSYATAFVTAFMALQAKRGATVNWADHTRNLGEAGRDQYFGWGLLLWPQTQAVCDY